MPKKNLIVFLLIILSFDFAISQSNKEAAFELGIEAIKLMDQGEIDKSLELLIKASELDPENINHPYEMALAYCKKENFIKSIEILDSLKNRPDAHDLVFQLLGNSYDLNGNRVKAFEIYQMGMDKFPNSGKFHQELGNIAYSKEDYSKAIVFWEDGLKVNPNYSSNYYKLAKIFSSSHERIWTLLYGEIFILLEPTTGRTQEISKLLFQTYQEVYNKENNSSAIVNLTNKGFQILMENYKDTAVVNNRQLTFEAVYATSSLSSAVNFQDKVDFASISKARNSFLYFWFKNEESHKTYQNKLLDYQKLMLENGVFDTYTYWLLSEGNPEEFQIYYNQNEEKISQFAEWFDKNLIQIDQKDFISRKDYE